jgi:four helix bundle protein
MSGYRELEIYRKAHDLGVRVHRMTRESPAFENYEEGAQVRRSSKRVSAGIVEGYALRKYRDEFLHYLWRSLASSDETVEHLQYLVETGSVKDRTKGAEFLSEYQTLSKQIARFIMGVERQHTTPSYLKSKIKNPKSRIQDSKSGIHAEEIS